MAEVAEQADVIGRLQRQLEEPVQQVRPRHTTRRARRTTGVSRETETYLSVVTGGNVASGGFQLYGVDLGELPLDADGNPSMEALRAALEQHGLRG